MASPVQPESLRHTFRHSQTEPYELYDLFDFEIPVGTEGDALDRYNVRMAEMEQSCRIIEQALDQLPEGEYLSKSVPSKLKPPKGDVYFSFESARVRRPTTWSATAVPLHIVVISGCPVSGTCMC